MSPKSVICWFYLIPFILQCKSHFDDIVYDDPCALVYHIEKESIDDRERSRRHLFKDSEYPLIACIAGYHSYTDSSEITPVGSPGYVGFFGIHSDDFSNCAMMEAYSVDEMRCVKDIIFKSEKLMTLYKRLCRPPLVKAVKCSNPEFVALDPIYKTAFAMYLSNPNNDIFKFAEFLDGLLNKAEAVSSTTPTPHTNKPAAVKDANISGNTVEYENPPMMGSSAIPGTTVKGIHITSGLNNGSTVAAEVVKATTPRRNVTSAIQYIRSTGRPTRSPSTTPRSKSESPVPSTFLTYRNVVTLLVILSLTYLVVRIVNITRTLLIRRTAGEYSL